MAKNRSQTNKLYYARLKQWAEWNGYTIEDTNKVDIAEIDFDTKLVRIPITHSTIHKIYDCLHELGHLVIWTDRNYPVEYKYVYSNKRQRHGKLYRFHYLKEEMLAWEEGFKLGRLLGLKISEDQYYLRAFDMLHSYIQFVIHPKKYETGKLFRADSGIK